MSTEKRLLFAVGYFPASGLRGELTGAFGNVSTYGYNWSSARSGAAARYAHYLVGTSTNVYLWNSAARAAGRTVRCVQEEVTPALRAEETENRRQEAMRAGSGDERRAR